MSSQRGEEYVAHNEAQLDGLIPRLRAGLTKDGVAVLHGFLSARGLETLREEADRLLPLCHRSVREPAGTVYVEAPDPSYPKGHPRRRPSTGAALGIVAYDQLPQASAIRALYEWKGLSRLLAASLGVPAVYPYADPLGAINLTYMRAGDHLGWHFDQSDFVVSLALSGPEAGGELESASRIRSRDDESYERVGAVLDGRAGEWLTRFEVTPGSLMVFQGRHSLHRVRAVDGTTVRCVALLGFDTEPGTTSTEQLRLARYGRVG